MLGGMASEDDGEGARPATQPRDLAWLAGVLDHASRRESHYRMAGSGREALGLALLDELPDDLPLQERAVAWALDYHVETVDDEGRRRVRLAPAFVHDDGSDPPEVRAVPAEVVDVWRELLDLVQEPPALARLHHLLFQHNGPNSVEHARSAAAAYLKSARDWDRGLDAVKDLAATTRLARAIDDRDLVSESLERMTDLAEQQLSSDDPLAGLVLGALRHLVGEPGCPDRVDDLLGRAVTVWPDANRRDRFLALVQERCQDDTSRAAVWRRRVEAYTEEAETASSKIMRAVRLQQALDLAERSGDSQLRNETASLLQTVRHDDLEMLTFRAASHRFEEESERLVETASAGEDWRQALISFATFGPLSGETGKNRALIEERHRQHPLGKLFHTDLRTPDGLPLYAGTSDDDRFDVDLAQWEAELIGQWMRVMALALHAIPERHGLPSLDEISGFLGQWPAVHGAVGPAIARSLLRYWAGDSEGASYTVLPRIETLVRSLVLRTDRGIYRLQQGHRPGQYVGLGQLLPILQEEYGLDESEARFMAITLRHPAGLNLRNLMLHGFVDDLGPGGAAVLLHTALRIATTRPVPASDGADSASE